MQKIDQTVRKETGYVALWILILSAVMQAVFLIIGKWHYAVLIANLISAAAGVLNFLFMGISLQKSLTKEPKDAALFMRGSAAGRFCVLAVITVLNVLLAKSLHFPAIFAALIPLIFPRIAIALSVLRGKKDQTASAEPSADSNGTEPTESTETQEKEETDDAT